jgi:hypothetical protein
LTTLLGILGRHSGTGSCGREEPLCSVFFFPWFLNLPRPLPLDLSGGVGRYYEKLYHMAGIGDALSYCRKQLRRLSSVTHVTPFAFFCFFLLFNSSSPHSNICGNLASHGEKQLRALVALLSAPA